MGLFMYSRFISAALMRRNISSYNSCFTFMPQISMIASTPSTLRTSVFLSMVVQFDTADQELKNIIIRILSSLESKSPILQI